MGRRGAKPIEERIGIERFKELTKRMGLKGIAFIYCEHYTEQSQRENCKACKRSLYRAVKRVREKTRQERAYEPMAQFEDIPEIIEYMEYIGNRGDKKSCLNLLKKMWNWIKESGKFAELTRPALWTEKHTRYILQKIQETKVSSYQPKQILRLFYRSMKSDEALSKLLITRRKDMASPNGSSRARDNFTPAEYAKIRAYLIDREMWKELMTIDLHLALKSREVSLLGVKWSDVNWHDEFYGFPMVTVRIFEPKGKCYWNHCPVDFWVHDLGERLKARHLDVGFPEEGYVCDMTYKEYLDLWHEISDYMKIKFQPHDCRRSAGSWLRDLGLSDLALGQYNPRKREGTGFAGVGWQNAEIYYQRYGKMNPKAIYNAKLSLDPSVFTGYIIKILEEKAKQVNR